MDPWQVWPLILVFILLSALFTCSETALFSLSRLEINRLRRHTRAGCRLAAQLLKEPQKLLTTILMGNEIADIVSSSLASWFFYETMGMAGKWVAYPLMSLLLFAWGDLLPKVIGFRFREAAACALSRPLYFFVLLLSPLRVLLLALAQGIFQLAGLSLSTGHRVPPEEEIKHLVEEAFASGALRPEERHFIYGLFETEETPVAAIMTPRKEIWALPDQEITPEVLSQLKKAPFHKIPVYQGDLDQVVGVLYLQDLLKARLQKKTLRLSEVARPAFFVPETTRVRQLLEEFQRRRLKLALVVNEYGRLSGLVTLEDVLEELFGEIYRREETKEPLLREIAPGRYLVKGRVHIEDFNRETGAELPEGEFRTLAGLVLHLFGRLPAEGEEVEGYGFRFRVEGLRDHRLETLLVERLEV
ncbi:hemolysin family protein [Thermosulfurimonas marina]|uniref:hemolysin family protein n=1 Tax=Thermosulfurimonas marina TaxID=2047767 RepID=UPI00144AF791|nr:hemolysin family protein [Thermosulfurimonas marina]